MTRANAFFVVSVVALAAACGGSVTSPNGDTSGDDGGDLGSDASPVADAGPKPVEDATAPQQADASGLVIMCTSARSCSHNQVCCAAISATGATVACANQCTGAQFQLCASDSECPRGTCTASQFGASYCTASAPAVDAGASRVDAGKGGEDGGSTDGGPADGGPKDGGPTDGGPKDGSSGDGGVADAPYDSATVTSDGGTDDGASADGADDDVTSQDTGTAE